MLDESENSLNDFWSIPFVKNLNGEGKLVYNYILTNKYTNSCGIFYLPKKIIMNNTGLTKETLNKLLKNFIKSKKILYNNATEEIFIIDWLKSHKIKDNYDIELINEELANVKTPAFIYKFHDICKENNLNYKKLISSDLNFYMVENL